MKTTALKAAYVPYCRQRYFFSATGFGRVWKCLLLVAVLTIACTNARAQQIQARIALEQLLKEDKKIRSYELTSDGKSIRSISFNSNDSYAASGTAKLLETYFGLRAELDLYAPKSSVNIDDHITVERYQQYFNHTVVDYGTIAVTIKDGMISYLTAEHYPINAQTSTTPVLTEQEALSKAISVIGARRYMWEEAGADRQDKMGGFPKGELVFVNDFNNKTGVHLAYKFDIYATEPLSRDYIYVSATDGSVLLRDAILKHANATATAATKYSGTKTIVTDHTGSTFRLREYVPTMLGIETLNAQRGITYSTAIEVTDADNNWTAAEYNNSNRDDALLDAHWGAEQVYRFWKNTMGRNSYDNAGGKIKSYVHYASNYDNAFWNGSCMTYGDGSYPGNANGFKPLTSLDVCGHEIAHGVCTYTSNLLYQKESGAMNEAFSDIWAACIEHESDPGAGTYEPFLIGEQITPGWIKNSNRLALRDMKDPPARGQPDTYGQVNWVSVSPCTPSNANDQCGVHVNSGVMNKWFYLLVTGETGVNDLSNSYTVAGIGFTRAQKIAYLLEVSLTSSATFASARTASINAATSLYGACSPEVITTTNAWYAVGVGAAYSGTCSPVVSFINSSSTISERNTEITCHPGKTIMATIRIDGDPVQTAAITLGLSGTAMQGKDYDIIPTTFSFAPGTGNSQDLTITVYDDAIVEGPETLNISYSINANGGGAVAGSANQVYSLTITDDDEAPVFGLTTSTPTTVLSEDFGVTGGTLPALWTSGNSLGTTNRWVIGENGTLGSGQGAYISTNTTSKPLDYFNEHTQAYLRTPMINAANISTMNCSFKYKSIGEQYSTVIYDYGQILYSLNGTTFFALPDLLQGVSSTTVFNLPLPDSLFANKNFMLEFRWANDNSLNTSPLTIDDVLITGIQTLRKTAIETAGDGRKTEYIPASSTTNIYSANDQQLLATLAGASVDIGCVEVSLNSTGNGQASLVTQSGTYNRTQKVFQLTPSLAGVNATYQLTLYFTPAELSVWGADALHLKLLKVSDAASLSGTIAAADLQVVTPTQVNDQTANGYIAYTGTFTGFSKFMLGVSTSTPLPVQFISVRATARDQVIDVNWAMATGHNTGLFVVERSTDGGQFITVAEVAGLPDHSNQLAYHIQDKEVMTGTRYYYRIRRIARNGVETLSEIRNAMLTGKAGAGFTLSPNPAKNQLKITATNTSDAAEIKIINVQGVVVRQTSIASLKSAVNLDIGNLPPGHYTVVLQTTAKNWVSRFLKVD